MMILFRLFFLSFLLPSISCKLLSFSRVYRHGPVNMSSTMSFFHEVHKSSNEAHFALLVSQTSSIDKINWLGIGIGEASSGGLPGTDLVTAQFYSNSDTLCNFVDRYVPFKPFPTVPYPLRDSCPFNDWTLISCVKNSTHAILEVSRSLSVRANDMEDRPIKPGLSAVLTTYDTKTFPVQGKNLPIRPKSKLIVLYEDDWDKQQMELSTQKPPESDTQIVVSHTEFDVPLEAKDYAVTCTSKKIEIPNGFKERMIVAAEAVLRPGRFVKYMKLFLCANKLYADKMIKTTKCSSTDTVDVPLGSLESGCTTFIYGYAKDDETTETDKVAPLVLPEDVGILVNEHRQYVVLETVFYNPDNITISDPDSSGVRLYLTLIPRLHKAGSLILGDVYNSRAPGRVNSGVNYEHTCPYVCTQHMSTPIHIFTTFTHMHLTGRSAHTNMYDRNFKYLKTISQIDFWSDKTQKITELRDIVTLQQGNQLLLSCSYDTTKKQNTFFGAGPKQETCIQFMHYWPVAYDLGARRMHEINVCGFLAYKKGGQQGSTICVDNGRVLDFFRSPRRFNFAVNPLFHDTTKLNLTFTDGQAEGEVEDSCPFIESTPGPISTIDNGGNPRSTPHAKVKPDENLDDALDDKDDDNGGDKNIAPEPTPAGVVVVQGTNGGSCFPSQARITVIKYNGNKSYTKMKTMSQLEVGDNVHVGNGKYSEVYMFSHMDEAGLYDFNVISFHNTTNQLVITSGHYIYMHDKRIQMAGHVKKGDIVLGGHGEALRVKDISKEWAMGLYNPHTWSGTIVVDGVLSSTYTEAIRSKTAEALLAVPRILFKNFGFDFTGVICDLAQRRFVWKVVETVKKLKI